MCHTHYIIFIVLDNPHHALHTFMEDVASYGLAVGLMFMVALHGLGKILKGPARQGEV